MVDQSLSCYRVGHWQNFRANQAKSSSLRERMFFFQIYLVAINLSLYPTLVVNEASKSGQKLKPLCHAIFVTLNLGSHNG